MRNRSLWGIGDAEKGYKISMGSRISKGERKDDAEFEAKTERAKNEEISFECGMPRADISGLQRQLFSVFSFFSFSFQGLLRLF